MDEKEARKVIREFKVLDSGVREEYASGMRRDTQEGKPDYTLIDIPFLTRLATHLVKGAKKYGEDNWRLANSREEWKRFKKSAFRHLIQWLSGLKDEDHAMATVFNIMCAEYVEEKLQPEENKSDDGQDLCTVFWESGKWQIMTYKELYALNPAISTQIRYFVDGVLTFHYLPVENPR